MTYQEFFEQQKLGTALTNYGTTYEDLTHQQRDNVNDLIGELYLKMYF